MAKISTSKWVTLKGTRPKPPSVVSTALLKSNATVQVTVCASLVLTEEVHKTKSHTLKLLNVRLAQLEGSVLQFYLHRRRKILKAKRP